jgi:transmembrane sensor
MNDLKRLARSGSETASVLERALRDPEQQMLATVLDDRFNEARAPRMWRNINRRLGQPRPAATRLIWLTPLVAALVFLVFGGWFRGGPLALSSGALPTFLESKRLTGPVELADGSHIELRAAGQLEVLQNDSSSFVTALRHGTGTFDVKPGGPRRWTVKAGPVTVEVLGTRFDVVRESERVTVRVERGVVLIRAEVLPDGLRRLTAGESVSVAVAAPAPKPAMGDAVSVEPRLDALGSPIAHPAQDDVEPATTGPTPMAASGANVSAPKAVVNLDVLLARADAARERGDTRAAATYLEEIVRVAPATDPRRGVAALSLARLTQHENPGRAAAALNRAMAGMPAALAEDALARQAQAAALSGDTKQAAWLAKEYLARFPNGRHAQDVKRWLPR